MISAHYTTAAIGISLAVTIFLLLRRDRLHPRHALWWILIASIILFISFNPKFLDNIGVYFGFAYPPMLGAIVALALLLIRTLLQDIEHTRLEVQIRRLAQQLSIYEVDLYYSKSNPKKEQSDV